MLFFFQDMFPDQEIVRSVQTELDTVIEEGVANIVQLLRNSESGISSGVARVPDDDAFDAKTRLHGRFKQWVHDSGKMLPQNSEDSAESVKDDGQPAVPKDGARIGGKLTERLVSQGLLTKDMVKQLKRELADKGSKARDSRSKR